MPQTTAVAADLGLLHTAKAIGYRVLNLDATIYSAFSTTGVAETNVLGFYRKDNGAVVPDAGGYIVWGVSGTDYAADTIPPAAPTAAQINAEVDTALADYDGPTKAELDSAVAPLASATNLATLAGYVDTEVAAIKTKTDALPADPADASDIAAAISGLNNLSSAQAQTAAEAALASAGVTTTVTGRIDAAITSRSTLTAQQVWEYSTRTLSSFGTLIADIWSNAIRTITGGSLTTAPPTAAQIDTQLSGTHGAGAWSTATGFATPTNITAGTITTVTNLTNAPTAGDLTATMKTSVTTAATAATPTVAAVTGNVGGNVVGSVGSATIVNGLAANVITAASIATDAITAAKVAADAVTKIQLGLATPTNITAGTITTVTNLTNAPTAGDLTATMKTSVATAVWAAATRTLTGYGTLVADVWAAVSRTITGGTIATVSDKTGYSLSVTPPTAAQIDTQLSGTHGAGAWATATGFATPANVTAAQAAIIAAQPSAAAVVAAIMAYAVATGLTFEQAMLNIWSVTAGDSTANDAQNPTSIVYDDPDGTTNVTHTLTDTTRVNV